MRSSRRRYWRASRTWWPTNPRQRRFAYQLHAWSNEGYLPPHSVTALYMVGKALHGSAAQEVELAPSTRVSLERLLGITQR